MKEGCKNCKFWDVYKYNKLDDEDLGECSIVGMFWEQTEWNGEFKRVLLDKYKDRKAFAQDGSDYSASLITRSRFYCNQYEKK